MIQKEDLISGVALGVFISIAIGIIVVFIFNPAFSSIIFILSLATLPGFFIMTLIYFFRLNKEKPFRINENEKFDWGVEVNLRKLQIIHNRYSTMFLTAGILASGSFFAMVLLGMDFPAWNTGHKILFPVATIMFIFSLHLAFRWWFAMREDYKYLKFKNIK